MFGSQNAAEKVSALLQNDADQRGFPMQGGKCTTPDACRLLLLRATVARYPMLQPWT